MLDFGFSEILLTSAIALVVLGPEKLPKVARQVGNWMGRARLMARQLSEQLEREVNAEELLRQQTRSSIPPPAPARKAALVAPEVTAFPAEVASTPATDAGTAAATIAPGAVVAQPVRRRTPHPNSPEMMHAKERMQAEALLADAPAAAQTTTTTPTSAEPQQSTQ